MQFDYSELSPEDAPFIQERAKRIKSRIGKLSAEDVLAIGGELVEVRERLPHGMYSAWVRSEFEWASRTIQQMLRVGERFKGANFAHLTFSVSALYRLSAKSVPDSAFAEAMERATAGEQITHVAAKEIIDRHQSGVDLRFDADKTLEQMEKAVESIGKNVPPACSEWFGEYLVLLGKQFIGRSRLVG